MTAFLWWLCILIVIAPYEIRSCATINAKRDEEKQKKADLAKSLQDICRKSIEEDKRRKFIKKRAENSAIPRKQDIVRNSSGNASTKSKETASSQVDAKIDQTPSSLPPQTDAELEELLDRVRLRAKTTIEEEEEDEYAETPDSIAWFAKQLYGLMGEEADYFLHPKMAQRVSKPVNPKLHAQGGESGVKKLWGTLRNESKKKLMEEDETIPRELKMAYSAFVRESLTKDWKPVKRNFFKKDDVPQMLQLIDTSRMERTNARKYRAGLMFRSSNMNEDKSRVLLHNKDMTEHDSGEDGVARFIPDNYTPEDKPEYKKWLVSTEEDDKSFSVESELKLLLSLANERDRATGGRPKILPSIHFLTEKESTVDGEFTKRWKEADERKRQEKLVSLRNSNGNTDGAIETNIRCVITAEGDTSEEIWEPLSMNALMEYSRQRNVAGRGGFTQGSMKYWNSAPLPAIHSQ
ncbi:DgyrCDS4535 [Dimorphilus gyrociliatus]|uniref:DgyrCDS4535 n=1 Tax=Dimorphilus gyrociliatus TaxID=2664684 RepID=A0A7I8VHT6_9ANNE|nr:DgyrCDS4535 [Dimorphilus gyrociliatus]